MSNAREIVERHMEAALAEAADNNVGRDVLARTMLDAVIKVYRESRDTDDIASELYFAADNLGDADDGIPFMRP